MAKTSIEWTDASWNPIVGCTEVSPGCANCYAARLASTRLRKTPGYKGLAGRGALKSGPWWTGEVRFLPERLEEPLHWKKPRCIFVCDMGDLFHERIPVSRISQVMGVIERCPQHTFQILTKRANLMQAFFRGIKPLPNVWLGVSVENQHFADERIPLLLDTPAAVRWISAEPLLGLVDLTSNKSSDGVRRNGIRTNFMTGQWWDHTGFEQTRNENNPHGFPRNKLDWVVCGGESGTFARPMHPDWARSLRDQCHAASVPFFFKQWGEWVDPQQNVCALHSSGEHDYVADGREHSEGCPNAKQFVVKVGKKKAGRLLDGREWNEFPK